MRANSVFATAIVLVMLGAGFSALSFDARGSQGDADDYGYAYTDSKPPAPSVSFSWVDIAATGTYLGLSGDDSYGGPYAIGFDFPFYGQTYSTYNISTNGFITFDPGSSSRTNYQIPNSYAPNNIIAPFWDNLVVDPNELMYEVIGAEPNRQFVLEWLNVHRSGYSSYLMTFEVILEESTGNMLFQYLSLNGSLGSGATVGIENAPGTVGVQYGYNEAILGDGLAILFSRLPVAIGPSQTEECPPGSNVTYSLTVRNMQPFSDTLDISCSSIEGWEVLLLNSSMGPLADTDMDGVPDVGELPGFGQATIAVNVEVPVFPAPLSDVTTVSATSSVDPLVSHSCTLTTIQPPAWFDPPHDDWGHDNDSDGLYDLLVVEVSVYARVEGSYYVYGELMTGSNITIRFDSAVGYVSAGTRQSFELSYFGYLIRDLGIDGPYRVDLTLWDDTWTMRDAGTYETSAYLHTDFEEIPAEFVLPFADEAVDEDLDGSYDFLEFEVYLDVNQAGWFYMGGNLYDSDWEWLDFAWAEEYLDEGAHTVVLRYDPWAIWTDAIDGVFNLEAFMYGKIMGEMESLDAVVYITGSYDASMFERPPAAFSSPHDDHAVDADGDLLWDTLVVEASLDVAAEGDYAVQGTLLSLYSDIIEVATVHTHLAEGDRTVELSFPGFSAWYSGIDGPYVVRLEVEGLGRLMDIDTHATQAYSYTEFEQEVAAFAPPHSSHCIDSDGDTLFDLFVLDVSLSVTVSGTYEVVADLYTPSGSYIGESEVTLHLDPGAAVAEVVFSGWLLRNHYDSGSFNLHIYLYDSSGRFLSFGVHTSDYYDYYEFDDWPAAFQSPHDGHAYDDDFDSIYDRYAANLTVEVYSAGTFLVTGTLYDDAFNWMSSASLWVTLEEGTQVVQLSFPGWMLHAHGYCSSYWVIGNLYDPCMNLLMSTIFNAPSYDYEDFDPTPPAIESAWASSSPAIDGSVASSEWSDATVVPLVGVPGMDYVPASLMVMNDGTTLYVCIDAYGDMSRDWADAVSLAFDTGNDGVMTSGQEHEFFMQGDWLTDRVHTTYSAYWLHWVEHCSPFKDDGLMGAVGFGSSPNHPEDHRMYEFAIPLSLLGISPGDAIGFIVGSHMCPGVLDARDSDASFWPAYSQDHSIVDETTYGQILSAEPVATPPPSTSATAAGTVGTNGWYVSVVNVTLSATGGDGGIDYTEYRVDGGSWTAYTAPISFQADGTHTLEYRSVDNAAQVEAAKTFVVKIDRVAPATTGAVSGTHVWLNATDATSGVGTTMYRIDGGEWHVYSGVLNISGEGTHTVEYYTVDLAGNSEPVQSLEVEVEESEGWNPLANMNFLMVLVIIAMIILISIGAIFGMRRKAKESDAKAAIKDIGSPYSQMMEEGPPKPPTGK